MGRLDVHSFFVVFPKDFKSLLLWMIVLVSHFLDSVDDEGVHYLDSVDDEGVRDEDVDEGFIVPEVHLVLKQPCMDQCFNVLVGVYKIILKRRCQLNYNSPHRLLKNY